LCFGVWLRDGLVAGCGVFRKFLQAKALALLLFFHDVLEAGVAYWVVTDDFSIFDWAIILKL